MRAFAFDQSQSLAQASDAAKQGSVVIAGGTTLIDLMKLDVMTPARVVDINSLPLRGISFGSNGLYIGALERMADVAEHPDVIKNYPVISQALLKSASAQLRNMASIGGNLMQRTRCGYFRDVHVSCNKRVPGSGCPALDGENRMHAILGVSEQCCATHPSDLAVALVALGASVRLQSVEGTREVKLEDFYLLPVQRQTKNMISVLANSLRRYKFRRWIGRANHSISRFAIVRRMNLRWSRRPLRSNSMGT